MKGGGAPSIMKGGAREYTLDILHKYTTPLTVYTGIALVAGITYVRFIPLEIRAQANGILGRLFLFVLTIFIADSYSWLYGLLMAVLSVLLLAVAPRSSAVVRREGFQSNGDTDVKLVTQKRKWWSEEVLQENPLGIEEDKVRTQAIQDQGNSSSSTTSSR